MGILKLFKMFRLLRLRKVSGLRGFTKIFKLHFKLVLVVFYLFLYVHLAACFWSLITNMDTEWIPPKDIGRESDYYKEGEISPRYVTALYYGTLMLLGADAYPRGVIAMIFASTVSLLGAVVIAVLFGNMTVLMDNLRLKSKLFNEEVDTANHVMATLNVPMKLQTRVMEYIGRTFRTKDNQRELNRFLLVISPSLKLQLSQYLFNAALKNNPVFRNKQMLSESLVRFIRIDGCNPEATITQQGQPGKAMYILAIGEVSVTVRNLGGVERTVRHLRSGAFFGEVALLTNSNRTGTVKAMNFCTYGTLSAAYLNELMAKFPSLKESLLQHIVQEYNDEQRNLVLERLSELPFVSVMSESERVLLYYSMQPCAFGKTQLVHNRGDSVDGLLVTVYGKLAVQMVLKRREWTSVVVQLPVGSICFSTTFLTDDPIVMEVVALETTFAYRLTRESLESNPQADFMQKVPRGELALSKYKEKIESGQKVVLDFLVPMRLHRTRKDLWKRFRVIALGLCQQAYSKRKREVNIRVSALIGILKSYLKARRPVSGKKGAEFDFQSDLQTVIQSTILLMNRVELLRLECSKLAKR